MKLVLMHAEVRKPQIQVDFFFEVNLFMVSTLLNFSASQVWDQTLGTQWLVL